MFGFALCYAFYDWETVLSLLRLFLFCMVYISGFVFGLCLVLRSFFFACQYLGLVAAVMDVVSGETMMGDEVQIVRSEWWI